MRGGRPLRVDQRKAVRRRPVVGGPVVRHPLPDVANHVVQPELILRAESLHRRREDVAVSPGVVARELAWAPKRARERQGRERASRRERARATGKRGGAVSARQFRRVVAPAWGWRGSTLLARSTGSNCISAVISAVSRPYLGCISAASRPHLGCISAASRLHLGCISAVSRLYLAWAALATSVQ